MKRSQSAPTLQLALDLSPTDEAVLEHISHQTRKRAKPRRSDTSGPAIDLEAAVALLEESPDYRILRRLKHRDVYNEDKATREFVGAFVDCETEGLNIEDKIIEIGLVRFVYDADSGKVMRLAESVQGYSAFEDPGMPLSAEIKRLTGIEDEDLAGHRFDDAAVEALVADAQLIIAHNAGFDRPRFERRFPFFASKPWACTFKDVNWSGNGISSAKLEFLAYAFGFFFDAHRAVNDCFAALELLTKTMPESGILVMRHLLEGSRKDNWRHFVNPAKFKNDRFRALGYRWCGKERASSWYKDYPDDASARAASELVANEGIATAQNIRRITARDRYSVREMNDE